MSDSGRTRKLRWLCRRGMKELDILLERFIDRHEEALSKGAWPQLENMLMAEDDVLWDWLQDPSATNNDQFRGMLVEIRENHAGPN